MSQFKKSLTLFCLLGSLSSMLACAQDNSSPTTKAGGISVDGDGLKPVPDPSTGICSALNFNGFSWPSNMFYFEKQGLQLALNITGSLEGPHGWQNLTNDFDGQGFSMGLMNQTLGTGSLQPLMIQMRDRHYDKFKSLFSTSHFQSLMSMLSNYESSRLNSLQTESEKNFSLLDISSNESGSANSSTASSVDWARRTVYDSKNTFNPIWKAELLSLAGSPEYVSLQVDAAWSLHTKALKLHSMMAVYELRTYLLMFDIVVQNGNLKEQDLSDYRDYVSRTPQATALQRLQKIVDLRLRWVKSIYRNDVRSRKMSIVNGTGAVHGANRNYEAQYCFNRRQSFLNQQTLP